MTALKKSVYPNANPGEPSHDAEKDLYFENQRLSRQLKSFIAKARQNEEKLRRFQELELRLIECGSLFELLQLVLYEYRATSRLDQVSLMLFDPEYEFRRILEDEGIPLGDHPNLMFTENQNDVESIYRYSYHPYLGHYRHDIHSSLFINSQHPPESIALLPMVHAGELVGSLNLGSHREERFSVGSATDFLERLATITAVCLNNVSLSERLKRVGLTDVLTGVNNRRFFDQRLREEVAHAQRKQQMLCALFFDVDHFKQINDTYGHQIGDQILREVAGLIRTQLRTSDILARYGGEEFAAILGDTPLNEAREIAERIRQAIAEQQYEIADSKHIHVTISVGVAGMQCVNTDSDPEEIGNLLLSHADECLYDAKKNGRNRVMNTLLEHPAANINE